MKKRWVDVLDRLSHGNPMISAEANHVGVDEETFTGFRAPSSSSYLRELF